jgi:hypothetical protein
MGLIDVWSLSYDDFTVIICAIIMDNSKILIQSRLSLKDSKNFARTFSVLLKANHLTNIQTNILQNTSWDTNFLKSNLFRNQDWYSCREWEERMRFHRKLEIMSNNLVRQTSGQITSMLLTQPFSGLWQNGLKPWKNFLKNQNLVSSKEPLASKISISSTSTWMTIKKKKFALNWSKIRPLWRERLQENWNNCGKKTLNFKAPFYLHRN